MNVQKYSNLCKFQSGYSFREVVEQVLASLIVSYPDLLSNGFSAIMPHIKIWKLLLCEIMFPTFLIKIT